MASVFLTGASGFVGSRVKRVLERRGNRVTAMGRDLLDPSGYRTQLADADTVLHLAAVTGKARPAAYRRVNLEGTRLLLETAAAQGAPRFLFASTIAVKFPDLRRYFYAQSKAAAEHLVAGSGLRYVNFRPTIVAGLGSPVLQGLARLAKLPIVPLPGGGQARVQPILVDDLAELIADLVDTPSLEGRTLEFGGPEVVTLRELLGRLRRMLTGRPVRFLPIPLGPLLPALGLLERIAARALPLTVGQAATFRFDGVATPNSLSEARRGRLAGLDAMLAAGLPS